MTVVKYLRNVFKYDGTESMTTINSDGATVTIHLGQTADLPDDTIARLSAYFVLVDPDVTDPPPVEGGGGGGASSWKPAVATKAALNALTSHTAGDVRAVIADETNGGTLVLYGYTGAPPWQVAGGSGGGGGGGVLPTGTPKNLFVQQTEPLVGELLLDSLWIPINVDGTAKTPSLWEVYTGSGDGNGVNLIIQQLQPDPPVVDALWIPLRSDGTAKYFNEWVFYTGRGSVVGVGNDNIFFQQALPAAPPVGSVLFPLNVDETVKTPDNWKVYA